ncbi:MAG: membrane dipeptidase [Thermodesulfobacteriota bacterium]
MITFKSNESRSGTTYLAVIAVFMMIGAGLFLGCGPVKTKSLPQIVRQRLVFADMHAHPGLFHRANAERIPLEEISLYRRQNIDLVVCSVSADAVYRGGYVNSAGTLIKRLNGGRVYPLKTGEAFRFSAERLERIPKTAEEGDAVLALNPATVLAARQKGRLTLQPALEGADGLEGNIENLEKLYQKGLRLLQLIHFRNNEIGFKQTKPIAPGGLTDFGKSVVRECNRLGIIIDLAHAGTRTTMDVLAISKHPVVDSHTGAKVIFKSDRHLEDDEIRAIAAKGGVIGIWPNGEDIPSMEEMMRHFDHVRELVGAKHIGIGSDLRGMKKYTAGFGRQADFRAIAAALLARGYPDTEVGQIMGGNFFSLWQAVSRDRSSIIWK